MTFDLNKSTFDIFNIKYLELAGFFLERDA
jgi:hypothetical protein